MNYKVRLLALIPALCALMIVLRLTVLRTPHTSDLSLGLSVGILLGVSVLSLTLLKHRLN